MQAALQAILQLSCKLKSAGLIEAKILVFSSTHPNNTKLSLLHYIV